MACLTRSVPNRLKRHYLLTILFENRSVGKKEVDSKLKASWIILSNEAIVLLYFGGRGPRAYHTEILSQSTGSRPMTGHSWKPQNTFFSTTKSIKEVCRVKCKYHLVICLPTHTLTNARIESISIAKESGRSLS